MSRFRTNIGDWNSIIICIWLSPQTSESSNKIDYLLNVHRWYYNNEKERKEIEAIIENSTKYEIIFKGQFNKYEAYVDQMAVAEGSIFGNALKEWLEIDNIRKVPGS